MLMRYLPLILPLLLFNFTGEPILHEPHQGHIQRILVGVQDDFGSAEGTLGFTCSLHLDQASDAE